MVDQNHSNLWMSDMTKTRPLTTGGSDTSPRLSPDTPNRIPQQPQRQVADPRPLARLRSGSAVTDLQQARRRSNGRRQQWIGSSPACPPSPNVDQPIEARGARWADPRSSSPAPLETRWTGNHAPGYTTSRWSRRRAKSRQITAVIFNHGILVVVDGKLIYASTNAFRC